MDVPRWRERLDSYRKALHFLQQAVRQAEYSELERAGLVQAFEFTFELGWKLLKDYLEAEGYVVNSPRSAIQTAVQAQLLSEENGYDWLEALQSRNRLAHTYDQAHSLEAERLIKQRYAPLLDRLSDYFQNQ
jgi:nucleotidyltransferase substrate binding protein (TIGR01987 family)